MLDTDLAADLLAAGLLWTPASGDRFVVPGRGLDDDVFHVADMTVEVHDFPSGRVLGFNGTTEWALDSLDLTDVLWLPREDQLRAELGHRFETLGRAGARWRVVTTEGTFDADDVEDAYARALLAALATTAPDPR